MNKLITLLSIVLITASVYGQNTKPVFIPQALVNPELNFNNAPSPYKLIVYGGVGCSYSKYLIENLYVVDSCSQIDIVIVMDKEIDIIRKHMVDYLSKYAIYSNAILQYKLTKNNDIFPQVLLFKDDKEVLHIKGVKKKMLSRIMETADCEKTKP